MASIKGIIVEIGGDTSGLQKALCKVNSNTASLSKELKGVNSLLKLDPKNTELVAQKQQVLKENIEETSKKLQELQKAQTLADEKMISGGEISQENYRNLQREIINTENKLKQLKVEASNWTTAGRSIEEFGNKIKNISTKIDKMGTTLTTRLTLPITAIATVAVTTGNSFEAQMSRVQAIAGATKDELKKLTDQAVELGAKTSFGATEVAQGMENLASAGFTTKEIMEAMPGMLDLAASSGADLAISSEIAASAIRGFGLEASTATHIADVYAEASARTNAQTEDMGEAMKYIAPVANTMGISLEETAAAIGIMSDAGIKGSQAGTSLRGALTRLTKPTDKMFKVMKDLGIEFYDNNGKMKSLTEMTAMLQKKTKGLTDEEKQNALTVLFGTESLSGMLSLINRGSIELDNMTKAFQNCDGSATEMAETMLDNTQGALESLSGSFESAGIAIQKALAPEIKELAGEIQSLVDDFNDLTDEEKENIIKTVALIASIGPAVKILGTMGKGLGTVTKGFGTFSQAIAVAKNKTTSTIPAINNLAKAFTLASNPVGLFTTVTIAAGAAIYAYDQKVMKSAKVAKEEREEIEKQIESKRKLTEEQNNQISTSIAEIENTNRLWNELKLITDENGKIKEGYTKRADFIVNELSKALGIELSLNGDIIKGYQNIQTEIDKTILKKKAEIYLQKEEENYKTALAEKESAYARLVELQNQYNEAYKKSSYNGNDFWKAQEAAAARIELQQLSTAMKEQQSLMDEYNKDISNYEYDYQLMTTNTAGSLQELINRNKITLSSDTTNLQTELQKQIELLQNKIESDKKMYNQAVIDKDESNKQAVINQINANNEEVKILGQKLASMTSTLEKMTPEQTNMWKNLAQMNKTAFIEIISQMPKEMQEELKRIAGVINADVGIAEGIKLLGKKVNNNFDLEVSTMQGTTSQAIVNATKVIKEDGNMILASQELGKNSAAKFDESKSAFEASGKNFVEGAEKGIENKRAQSSVLSKVTSFGKSILKAFNISLGEHSPSVFAEESGENFDIGAQLGIERNQKGALDAISSFGNKLTNEFDKQFSYNNFDTSKFQGSLNNKIIDSTKTIFTTPNLTIYTQEFDARKIANEVNKIFGSQY